MFSSNTKKSVAKPKVTEAFVVEAILRPVFLALFAYECYVSHKLHRHGYDAFAFAGVAAPTVLIEREVRCRA